MKTKTLNRLLLVMGLPLLLACGKNSSLGKEDYVAYVNDPSSQLVKSKSIHGISYSLRFQPNEFIVLRDHHFGSIQPEAFSKELGSMKGLEYFMLSIKDEEGSNEVKKAIYNKEAYGALLEKITSAFQTNIQLKAGDDLIYPSAYHAEPPSTIRPELNFMIMFDLGNSVSATGQDQQLIVNDDIFNNGPVKFTFEPAVVADIPTLNL
ncbi:MAG: hypothetical protein K0S33_440 [Bacteroidetes bacterium]|jgi:hypothetical protein|nr:hypothetical protein [Bacteroidota bacterium]